jgi:hypothetical protein
MFSFKFNLKYFLSDSVAHTASTAIVEAEVGGSESMASLGKK